MAMSHTARQPATVLTLNQIAQARDLPLGFLPKSFKSPYAMAWSNTAKTKSYWSVEDTSQEA
jgi:hypothetical protein